MTTYRPVRKTVYFGPESAEETVDIPDDAIQVDVNYRGPIDKPGIEVTPKYSTTIWYLQPVEP